MYYFRPEITDIWGDPLDVDQDPWEFIPPSNESPKPSRESSMFDDVLDDLVYKVNDVVVDLQTGKVGVRYSDAVYSYVPGATPAKGKITKNPFKGLVVDVPAYAMPVPADALKPGDIIVLDDDNDDWAFFKSLSKSDENSEDVTIKVIGIETGKHAEITQPVHILFGNKNVQTVRTLGGDLTNSSSLLPLLLLGKDDSNDSDDSFSKLLPLLLMNSGNKLFGGDGSGLDLKSMLPMLLMSGKADFKKILPLLLLQNGGTGMDLSSLLPFLALKS